MQCFRCRDKGAPDGCTYCGKVLETEHSTTEVITPEKYEFTAIPPYYQGMTWNEDLLLAHYPNSDSLFTSYVKQLTKIYQIFANGKLPSRSFILISKKARGKTTWAYCCMQQALAHGYTVMPILDNTQFKRLNIISSDRISSKLLKEYSFTVDQYIAADVVMLAIDPDNFQGSYRTIDSLVSKRARLGKNTIILSGYDLRQLSILDFDDTFKEMQYTVSEDLNKYLVVVRG